MRRLPNARGRILLAVAAVLSAAPAEAYYQYVHYPTPGAPYTPVYEKFDLTAFPNKTVTFLVADAGPAAFAYLQQRLQLLGHAVEVAGKLPQLVAGGITRRRREVAAAPSGGCLRDLPETPRHPARDDEAEDQADQPGQHGDDEDEPQ